MREKDGRVRQTPCICLYLCCSNLSIQSIVCYATKDKYDFPNDWIVKGVCIHVCIHANRDIRLSKFVLCQTKMFPVREIVKTEFLFQQAKANMFLTSSFEDNRCDSHLQHVPRLGGFEVWWKWRRQTTFPIPSVSSLLTHRPCPC